MDFHLGHTIAVLQRTPAALDALLRGLPDPWLHGDEGPDTWSPYVVVGHLIHQDETNWLPEPRPCSSTAKRRYSPTSTASPSSSAFRIDPSGSCSTSSLGFEGTASTASRP